MTDEQTSVAPSVPVAVLRIGSHPVVYSVIATMAVGALVFFFAIVPLVKMIEPGGVASITDAQNRNRTAEDKLSAMQQLVDSAASISSADRKRLAYALPAHEDTPGLAVILRSLALRSGVKLTSLDISQTAQSSTDTENPLAQSVLSTQVNLSLDLVTYEKLKLVLTTIENSLRLFDIQSYTFSPSTGGCSLQMKTYYLSST